MKTIIYIDGFNFYYGCVKGTSFKWLDVQAFFKSILTSDHEIIEIKYFTARSLNKEKADMQEIYFKALKSFLEPNIKINFFFGDNVIREKKLKAVNPPPEKVKVYKIEEKGSDVNLAAEILNDAWLNKYECAVLVSGDADMVGVMERIRNNASQGIFTKKKLGLIIPAYKKGRATSAFELEEIADFTKVISPDKIRGREGKNSSNESIMTTEQLLRDCQLPIQIPNTNLYCPIKWR